MVFNMVWSSSSSVVVRYNVIYLVESGVSSGMSLSIKRRTRHFLTRVLAWSMNFSSHRSRFMQHLG